MKLFLLIHFILWLCWTIIVVLGASVWSGFTDNYIQTIMPFILIYSHIQVISFSIFVFLLIYFLKSTLQIKRKE